MTKMAAMVIHGKTFTRIRMAIISLKSSIENHFVFYLQLNCQDTREGYPQMQIFILTRDGAKGDQ